MTRNQFIELAKNSGFTIEQCKDGSQFLCYNGILDGPDIELDRCDTCKFVALSESEVKKWLNEFKRIYE